MFQRLKGAIDSRIAEEQARQQQSTVSRSNSTPRRSTSRTASPSTRPRRVKPKETDGPLARSPDPSEFESAFAIEDEEEDDEPKGVAPAVDEKPSPMTDTTVTPTDSAPGDGGDKGAEKAAATPAKPTGLPADVRVKLKRLENLESKYKDLLRSYRLAYNRAILIEPFEKALKENTPLATIADPDALTEYLSQINLKGDMVMDELKRVSADRDDQKKKLEESEKRASSAQKDLEDLQSSAKSDGTTNGLNEKDDTASIDTPDASVKSPVSSVLGIFSPKQKPQEASENKDDSEEFFSYDDEVPKLQQEVKDKTAEVEGLKSKVDSLERDVAVARESSSGLVESLEKATRELNESKEAAIGGQSRREQLEALTKEFDALKLTLKAKEQQLADLETSLANHKKEFAQKVTSLESDIANQKKSAAEKLQLEVNAHKEVESARQKLDSQIKDLEKARVNDAKRIQELADSKNLLESQIAEKEKQEADSPESKAIPPAAPSAEATTSGAPGTGGGKKKNKKKKKPGNAAAGGGGAKEAVAEKDLEPHPSTPATDLEAEISRLKDEVANRDAQIAQLQTKRKTEEELREELENMQDNFLNIGQEHVEAKEKIKDLQTEKKALQERITKLEKEIETYQAQSKGANKVEVDFKSLTAEYEDLKLKSATLQTDLGAAQQLATSRYRDLTDLRDVLQKAQPELKSLRAENANLKSTKDELAARTADLRRLEAREKDLKSDVASFKKQAADRENKIRELSEQVTQETNGRLRAEDQARVAQRDLRRSEAEKIKLAASGEKSISELEKIQDEARKLKVKVRDLEDQVLKLTSDSKGLREEAELRGSQYNNAQGLLGSMRDQTSEMAMQLKEAKEQSESLEEELAEVQRLLSERTREGETMRRLLADVDDRAEAKIREMRERMEAAIEERDRAEDEASTNGRRRAREADELKTKIRDFERELKRATDDRDELQQSEKEWKRKRDALEGVSEKAAQEVNEMHSAMGELRSALDGSEKQVREAEKQRTDLRRILDEANQRYEKLQKEFRALQAKQSRLNDVSSRSSIDSGRAGSPINGAATSQGAPMDVVYLKTVLLGFLQQKDKKRQADLVKTVLGQLLRFDKKDQDKWIAAIAAK